MESQGYLMWSLGFILLWFIFFFWGDGSFTIIIFQIVVGLFLIINWWGYIKHKNETKN